MVVFPLFSLESKPQNLFDPNHNHRPASLGRCGIRTTGAGPPTRRPAGCGNGGHVNKATRGQSGLGARWVCAGRGLYCPGHCWKETKKGPKRSFLYKGCSLDSMLVCRGSDLLYFCPARFEMESLQEGAWIFEGHPVIWPNIQWPILLDLRYPFCQASQMT